MKLFLDTVNGGELGYCKYAYLDLTPQLAKQILRRKLDFLTERQADGSLSSMVYEVRCEEDTLGFVNEVDDPDVQDALQDALDDDEGYVVVESLPKGLSDIQEATDHLTMSVTRFGVYWTCFSAHDDGQRPVRTREIDYNTVEAAATEGG